MLGLVATAALANVLAADRVAVGVSDRGAFGADGVGLLWDPDAAAGPEPQESDWLGADGWSLTWAGGAWEGGALAWSDVIVTEAMVWAGGVVESGPVTVSLTHAVPWEDDLVWTEVVVENTGDVIVDEVWLTRFADLEPERARYGIADTDNAFGSAFAVAGPVRGERALAIAAVDGVGGTCRDCSGGLGAEAGVADLAIGVAVPIGSLEPGDQVVVDFVYAFGIGADAAVELALTAADEDDRDLDGVVDDCDPRDPLVGEGLDELPDGVDNDCDGIIDEGTRLVDDDGDGVSEAEGDCDDGDPTVFPGAPQAPDRDADCDGMLDEGWDELPGATCACSSTSPRGSLGLVLAWLAWRRRCVRSSSA